MTSHATTPFTPLDSSGEPVGRAIPLGLGGLSAGIAAMGDLAVTVDGVPGAARLSAGQFLGDGRWSLRPADLDHLALHPSPGHNRNCRISIRFRKIDKDMGDVFSIGAVYIDIDADAGRAIIASTDGAISLWRKDADAEEAPPAEAAPKPVRRTVRVARTSPVRSTSIPPKVESPPKSSAPDPLPMDQEKRAWPTAAASVELPVRSIPAPDPNELGGAPPAALDENAQLPDMPTPAPNQSSPASADEIGIVTVRVTSGLRIGKFGKTGRPEEVVSVRGRDDPKRARPGRGGSIVMVRQRSGDSRPA